MNKDITYAVDHIGYAVKDIRSAIGSFEVLGYSFGSVRVDACRKVNVCLGESVCGGAKIELLSPMDGEKSPIDGVLQKNGAAPYHICYKVKDIHVAIERLGGYGFLLIDSPARSEPLGGDVCFLFSPQVGIVELIEY